MKILATHGDQLHDWRAARRADDWHGESKDEIISPPVSDASILSEGDVFDIAM